ncbi:Sedlin N-terminal conserved region-containing protein [Spironucleus salmonicida]|uniref:Sedlin N-terminal conserved region-containing protein n=1 Tax=Spironucleus salmonicida TaxID=348837 RepID=V6LEV9_9EUKA|nr:Sedlin N-terminal conserved region-containing protein [Spironucleus salmonicida]|eukprot:EST42803.1 Sedlin N-terminal conserved region-containing protein [Spironucleus salmonicida]
MTVSVAVISKTQQFQFTGQYVKGTPNYQVLDPSTYLFFYSLMDEVFQIFKQTSNQSLHKMNIGTDFLQQVHGYRTFTGSVILIGIQNDITVSEEKVKNCFISIHKILSLAMMNIFYKDNTMLEDDVLINDIGTAVYPLTI